MTVELQDNSGAALATTTTGATGLYEFTGLAAGDYRIEFMAPERFQASPRQAGADPAVDSDGLVSDVVTLAAGETNATIDAGLFEAPPAINVSIDDITLMEAGGTSDQFTLTVSEASTEDVIVQWSVADATAAFGDDYTGAPPVPSSGQTTIAAGDTEARLDPGDYSAVDDDEIDGNETFEVTLTSVSGGGAILGDKTVGTGTIVDNDDGSEDIIVWQNGLGPTSGVEIGTPDSSNKHHDWHRRERPVRRCLVGRRRHGRLERSRQLAGLIAADRC